MTSQFLFIGGIALGVLGAAKIPQDSISLTLFAVGVGLSIVGVWLLYRHEHQVERLAQQQNAVELAKTQTLFSDLCADLKRLESQLAADSKDRQKILSAVNNLFDHYVIPLVALQSQVNKQLGRHQAADIYIAIAQGERLLNRMRSSLGDGCWFETYQVFPRMSAALQLASERWHEHMVTHD